MRTCFCPHNSWLLPQEAPVTIAEKRKLFFPLSSCPHFQSPRHLCCTYLAHHELESLVAVVAIMPFHELG